MRRRGRRKSFGRGFGRGRRRYGRSRRRGGRSSRRFAVSRKYAKAGRRI